MKLINSGDIWVEQLFLNLHLKSNVFYVWRSHFGFAENLYSNGLIGQLMDRFIDFGVRAHSEFLTWCKSENLRI